MPDTFSETEARRVFARAAERQHAAEARGERLTLGELQAIGAEAGLDPAYVAAAVAELGTDPPARAPLTSDIDLAPRRVRVIPAPLTDDLWADLVRRLRQTYGVQGVVSEIGPLREWRKGPDARLHVIAEAVEGGTRVTLETSRAESAGQAPLALGVGGVALAVFMAVLGLATGKAGDPVMWGFVVVFLLMGIVAGWSERRSLRRWSARRHEEFARLLTAMEGHAAQAPPTPVRDDESTPRVLGEGRIEAGWLGDDPVEGAQEVVPAADHRRERG